MKPTPGRLLIVPNTLDLGSMADGAPALDLRLLLPQGVIDTAAGLAHWSCENAKTTRAFLKRVHAITPLAQALQTIDIRELPRAAKGRAPAKTGNAPHEFEPWLAVLRAGQDVGLLSEAGLPAVADPGAALVAAAHAEGLPVLPLPGASSLSLALAASGLDGQSFAFVGYVPQEPAARSTRLRELEATSRRMVQTQLIIETPYRNAALLAALAETLAPATTLAIACGLTLPNGWVRSGRIDQWRQQLVQMPTDLPAVFMLQA
jgi:16S rRNA (cytidine1402-2'-O)-methyltransferase